MLLQLSTKIRMSWHRSAEVSDAQRIGIILGRAFLEWVASYIAKGEVLRIKFVHFDFV